MGPFTTSTALSAPTVNYGQPGLVTATLTVPGFSTPLTTGGTMYLTVDAGTVSAATYAGTLTNGAYTFNVGLLADGTHQLALSYPAQATDQGTGGGHLELLQSGMTGTLKVLPSIYVLNATGNGTLTVSGSASVSVPGVIVVDSTSASAVTASSTAQLTAGSLPLSGIEVAGGFKISGNAVVSPTPVTNANLSGDPLANLPVPSVSGLSRGPISLGGNASQTISPGIYTKISLSGSSSLTLLPGIYVIAGGGISESGSASITVASGPNVQPDPVTGTGVLIYNTSGTYTSTNTSPTGGSWGAISLSGSGHLTAATGGPYAGLVIFQDRNNTQAMSFSGNIVAGITGTVYAKQATVSISGSSKFNDSLVAGALSVSGNAIINTLGSTGAYTPDQVRTAYGVNNLSLNGSGQTIAIVDAYDNPSILASVDAFDSQFTAAGSGPTLYQQYGPASTFLTVVNQRGQAGSLPATDPTGAGVANWEMEEALDVEWIHANAPGAQIVLVEANSQSLSDLMGSVATAAGLPGVSVVSMSWGFTEGQAVLAADEAMYDQYLTTPAGHQGVTFVASTGDYGTNNPEYPAFSPNVVAVGGSSLKLNAENSYNSETGWGGYSNLYGTLIAGGGGVSSYEAEPAYQVGVQSTGFRTTPDVSLVADPATGAWIADTYNQAANNPFETVGGTSLAAPAWAGIFALVNQGRTAAGQATLNSSSPTEAQQGLYGLSQSDYNVITAGSNGGFNAAAGYNLVTGLGTPIADRLVADMIAGNYPATGRVASINANLNANPNYSNSAGGSTINVINVFAALTPGDLGHVSFTAGGGTLGARALALNGQAALMPARDTAPSISGTATAPVAVAAEAASISLPSNAGVNAILGNLFGAPVDVVRTVASSPDLVAIAGFGSNTLPTAAAAIVDVVPVVPASATTVPVIEAGPRGDEALSSPSPAGDLLFPVQQGSISDDVLVGGDGTDILIGEARRDVPVGGSGPERVAADSAEASETITAESDDIADCTIEGGDQNAL
jgi:hypothetical protein